LILNKCLFGPALLQEGVPETCVGRGIIRLYCQSFLPLRNRIVDPALLKEHAPEVVIGIAIIRPELNRFLIVHDRFIWSSFSSKRSGQPRGNLKLRWLSMPQAKDTAAEDARSLPGLLLSRRSVETDRCKAGRYTGRHVLVRQSERFR